MRFIFISVILILVAGISATDYCKLDTETCSCIADNGYGVDLRNISGKWWSTIDSGLGAVPTEGFIVSLCKDSHTVPDFVDEKSGCAGGYSVCSITAAKDNANKTIYKAQALLRDQKWTGVNKTTTEDKSLTLNYGQDGSIRMVCVQDAIDTTLVHRDNKLYLYSPASCLALLRPPPVPVEGLGAGAVISIIILVTLFSYCTLGIVYNHFVRGTRGAELIPNIDFWRQLPGLIMDGIRFIQNGCRPPNGDMGSSGGGGRETYDSI